MKELRAECIARLQQAGLRPSEPRIAVLAFLMKHRIHPVAETIYQSLAPDYPTLSRTTIYNTLKLFEQNKIVMSLTIEDGELRYDINTSLHGHFKCRHCHSVTDIFIDGLDTKIPLPQNDCKVESIHLDFFGLCGNCRVENE